MSKEKFTSRSTFSFHSTVVAIALLAFGVVSTTALAQSGTRNSRASGAAAAGSGTKTPTAQTALQGYCPVCVVEMKKWIKGNPQFTVQQDGKTYLFPSDEQKQMFLQDPNKYTPALGGDCVVAQVDMGKRVPGSVEHVALHNDRLYLFSNAKAKNMFLADKEKYASADLAIDGKCTVCRVEMNKEVDGLPNFVSFRNGMRYWFPRQEQQQMFNQNPTKYEVR